jgi:Uma2 family endonuclease
MGEHAMATATTKPVQVFGPDSAGIRMTPREFDRADFVEGWRYELIDGVLVVSPTPLEQERDPNEELGYMLRDYQHRHPQGSHLDKTLSEHTVDTGETRRRADRVIWAGLGRRPRRTETPTIVGEFLSAGKRNRRRDLEEKRHEYMTLCVSEYWIMDRFRREMTVYSKHGKRVRKQVIGEKQIYTTPLLPGFELPFARLLALADEWSEEASLEMP